MPLKNVGRIVGGGTPKTSVTEYWKDGTIVWFTPADLGKVTGVYASDSERKITELGLAKSSAVLMPPNSIIFSSRAPIGYIAVATKHCCTNQGCKSFVPDLKVIDSLWGYFAIRARTPDIIARASGTTFKEISGKEVGETLIPIPPLLEQQRIVKRLIEIQTLIDSYGKEQEALEELEQKLPSELKASLLQEAIRGKLVPQLESEPEVTQIGSAPDDVPFDIPKKWKWIQLGNIGRWKAGGTPSRSHEEYYQHGNIPWLKTGDLTDGIVESVEEYITEEAIENSSTHINPIGSVLIAMYGATIGKLGILKFPCATNQACCACDVNVQICDRWYLFYYLLSQRKAFIAKGAGGAQPNISRTKIVNHLIPLPPIEEQRRVVQKIQYLFQILEEYIH